MTHRPLMFAALAVLAPTLAACPASARLRDRSGPYQIEVLVDGVPTTTYARLGETYVLGRLGERYELRVWNHSDRRVEVVTTVDGRDVIDGQTGDFRSKRGYLVAAGGSVTIDGWRLSRSEAAAFRFSTVADSYAARTGSARDVGVIGVAVFPERVRAIVPPRPVQQAQDAPSSRNRYDGYDAGENKDAQAPSAAKAEGRGREADGKLDSMAPERRPGLGTGFGEAVSSPIEEVEFVRASPARPAALLGLRYDDARGLRALGIDLDGDRPRWDEAERRHNADPFPAERGFALPPPGWRQ